MKRIKLNPEPDLSSNTFIIRDRTRPNKYLQPLLNGTEWKARETAMKFGNEGTARMIAAQVGGIVERVGL